MNQQEVLINRAPQCYQIYLHHIA